MHDITRQIPRPKNPRVLSWDSMPFDPPNLKPHSRRQNLTGQRFGRLLIFGIHSRSGVRILWLARCDCGSWIITSTASLTLLKTRSCGCYGTQLQKTHGMSGLAEYGIYRSAKARCTNSKHKQFPDYGGRGIKFLFTSFNAFMDALGERPSSQHSLDRIDNNGHYEPNNVRWATRIEQCSNRRSSTLIEYHGRSETVAEWARILGVPVTRLWWRLRNNWDVHKALAEPFVPRETRGGRR
jgi:hypothetical protein